MSNHPHPDFLYRQLTTTNINELTENYKLLVKTIVETYPPLAERRGMGQTELEIGIAKDLNFHMVGDPVLMRFIMLISLPMVPAFYDYCMSNTDNKANLNVFSQRVADGIKEMIFPVGKKGPVATSLEDMKYPSYAEFVAEMVNVYMRGALTYGENDGKNYPKYSIPFSKLVVKSFK